MVTKLRTVHAKEDDMTFIMEEKYVNESLFSTEVVGFYYGEPDDYTTNFYRGDRLARFSF